MTIFIWKPRVGQLANIKDKPTIDHYERTIEEKREELEIKPHFMDGMPYI